VQQAGDAAKTARLPCCVSGQQFLRHLQHALARDAGAQQQRQQLGIARAPGPRASSFSRGWASVGRSLSGMGRGAGRGRVSTMEASLSGLSMTNCPTVTGFFPHVALPPGRAGGDIINTFNDKPATLSLGTGELSPAMEQRLMGWKRARAPL
jgi:hypothetical protein